MYNLLVTSSFDAWKRSPYRSIGVSRFLQYTDPAIQNSFRSLDAAAIARLCELPALFMYEEANREQPGSIGHVVGVRCENDALIISFKIADRSRRITWDDLDDLAELLGIEDAFEPRTTHWAIKDVDLLDVLKDVGLQQKATHPQVTSAVHARQIVDALDQFDECVRYLNTRRIAQSPFEVDSESAVQDLLYLMLRPWVADLTVEDPGSKVANRFTIKDFFSKTAQAVIEAKFIRDAAHGKSVTKELHDDIEMYRTHPFCHTIIFFVYDRNQLIPDKTALVRQIAGVARTYDGAPLTCHVIIKP